MYKKYPRTPHLPWSPGATNDDKILYDVSHLENKYVVVTEKRDGENTTMYPNHIHARSLDSKDHFSRHYIKALHAKIKQDIPEGFRICGENLHYTKSIHYNNLTDFFEVFSIWRYPLDGYDICLAWGEVEEWCELLGLQHVPVLYKGVWDENIIRNIPLDYDKVEGYVVRDISRFTYQRFDENVAKYVRKGHVQTDEHWMNQQLTPNGLKR